MAQFATSRVNVYSYRNIQSWWSVVLVWTTSLYEHHRKITMQDNGEDYWSALIDTAIQDEAAPIYELGSLAESCFASTTILRSDV
jgi:hypothetical protein